MKYPHTFLHTLCGRSFSVYFWRSHTQEIFFLSTTSLPPGLEHCLKWVNQTHWSPPTSSCWVKPSHKKRWDQQHFTLHASLKGLVFIIINQFNGVQQFQSLDSIHFCAVFACFDHLFNSSLIVLNDAVYDYELMTITIRLYWGMMINDQFFVDWFHT